MRTKYIRYVEFHSYHQTHGDIKIPHEKYFAKNKIIDEIYEIFGRK